MSVKFVEFMKSHLIVLRDENVVAINLEKTVDGEQLREGHTVDRYLLLIYIRQAVVWQMSKLLPPDLNDIRIGNH